MHANSSKVAHTCPLHPHVRRMHAQWRCSGLDRRQRRHINFRTHFAAAAAPTRARATVGASARRPKAWASFAGLPAPSSFANRTGADRERRSLDAIAWGSPQSAGAAIPQAVMRGGRDRSAARKRFAVSLSASRWGATPQFPPVLCSFPVMRTLRGGHEALGRLASHAAVVSVVCLYPALSRRSARSPSGWGLQYDSQ